MTKHRIFLFALGLGLLTRALVAAGSLPGGDPIETTVSRFTWNDRTEAGAMHETAIALRLKVVSPKCRVNRTFVRGADGYRGVFTEESFFGKGVVGDGSSFRGVSPQRVLVEIAMRAPIDLDVDSISSVTPEAFERAVNRLSKEELEQAADAQIVSVHNAHGLSVELSGLGGGGGLAERVVEQLNEIQASHADSSLMSPPEVDQLAALLRILWADRKGVLLFGKENLLFEVLEEIYPDSLELERLTGESLRMHGERVEDSEDALDAANRWANEFGMTEPLSDTCLEGTTSHGAEPTSESPGSSKSAEASSQRRAPQSE